MDRSLLSGERRHVTDEWVHVSGRWMRSENPAAADAIAAIVPNAKRVTREGQEHVADPKAVVDALEPFFGAT